MHLETFMYTKQKGWSISEFPKMDGKNTLVLVFGAPEFLDAPEPLQDLKNAYPSSSIMGCSTSGEIYDTSISDGSLSVAVLGFEATNVRMAAVKIAETSDDSSFDAGKALANELNDPSLRSILVLSDGLAVNGSKLVDGLNAVVSDSVIVTGGLAGDGARFQRTWILAGGMPASGWVSAVGLYGDRVKVGHGSMGGFDKFGPERVVTKSAGKVVFELDGKPALGLYKTYLGDRASELPASALLFPLMMRQSTQDEKSLVRTVLAVDEEKQSITFAGDIRTGALVQLMRANFDRVIDGASGAAKNIGWSHSGGDSLAIAISCVGRRLILGERTEEEVEASLDVFPSGTKQVGFYSYGEISPFSTGKCDLHNQTMTLTTIGEA